MRLILRKPRKRKSMTAGCVRTLQEMPQLVVDAMQAGLTVRVAVPTGARGRQSLHIMFSAAATGQRVLDWWPSTSCWYDASTKDKGLAKRPADAIREASRRMQERQVQPASN